MTSDSVLCCWTSQSPGASCALPRVICHSSSRSRRLEFWNWVRPFSTRLDEELRWEEIKIGGKCNTLYIQHLLWNTRVTSLELHNGFKGKWLTLTGSAHLITMINRACRWFCSGDWDVGRRWCLSQTQFSSTWWLQRSSIAPTILMDGEWGSRSGSGSGRRGSATRYSYGSGKVVLNWMLEDAPCPHWSLGSTLNPFIYPLLLFCCGVGCVVDAE